VVTEVIASVAIDASGLNFDRDVDLIAVDSNGNQVPNVELNPDRARVRIAVARELANVTLPVVPQIVGVPAPGFRISSVIVDPLTVTYSGEESIVSQLQTAQTDPIDVTDRTTDLEAMVRFDVPDGVSVSGVDSARVVVTIEQETGTRTFTVAVQTDGRDDPASVTLAPDQVSVTLGGPLADLAAIDASQLVATATVGPTTTGGTVTIQFEPPDGLQVVSITPDQVQVTVAPSPAPSSSLAP
jgi:YbbR domain-containing protein